jgi:hypothetical protein
MSICELIKDFTPEKGRIYSVRAIAFGMRNKKKVHKKFDLTVYVLENEKNFIERICLRSENQNPKIKKIYRIEIYYIRKAGFIQNN